MDKPFPLAAYLSSRDPALRARAETELYRLGPNAGEALLHAAEQETRPLLERNVSSRPIFPLLIMYFFGFPFVSGVVGPTDLVLLLLLLLYFPSLFLMFSLIALFKIVRHSRLEALALALARRDDLRSVGPLVNVWRPTAVWQPRPAYARISTEEELTRLLPDFVSQTRLGLRPEHLKVVRDKTTRLFPRRLSGLRVRLVPRGEFTDTRADLLVTIIQLLTRTGDSKDRAVVERIARSVARTENQQLVREAAQVCLDVLPRPLHQRLPPLTSHQPSAPARVSVRKQIP